MRKIFSNKKLAAVAVAAVAITGTGVAYAWWTTGGTGSGSATVGTDTDNLVITGTPKAGEPVLIPGGGNNELQLSVVNPNTYSAMLNGQSLKIVPGSITCQLPATPDTTDVDPVPVTVPNDWFSVVDDSIATAVVAAPNGATTVIPNSHVSIGMHDRAVNQDACKLAKVAFSLTVGDPA